MTSVVFTCTREHNIYLPISKENNNITFHVYDLYINRDVCLRTTLIMYDVPVLDHVEIRAQYNR